LGKTQFPQIPPSTNIAPVDLHSMWLNALEAEDRLDIWIAMSVVKVVVLGLILQLTYKNNTVNNALSIFLG
jgi:hypothetical protein